ncbi:MAG: site-specific integrase [Balneolales bacterium]
MYLEVLISYYLIDQQDKWSDKTRITNKERLSQIDLNLPVSRISQGHFQRWLDGLSVSVHTKKSYASTLNTFLRWAYRNEYCELLKVALSNKDRKDLQVRRIKYITLEQLETLCDTLDTLTGNRKSKYTPVSRTRLYMKEIWRFAFWQALRREEIIRIQPGDIQNLRFITIHGKGGSVDTIPIVEPAKEILKPWLDKNQNPLFGLTSSKNLWRTFNECVNIAFPGSGLNLHSLRHGGIVHYLSQGIGINFVSKLARHKSVRITADVYGDIIPTSVEDAFKNIPGISPK